MYSPRTNLKSCLTCLCLRNYLRNVSTSTAAFAASHYDSLGITPAATQTEVKSAYYKLSKVYHPDRNDGSEKSAQKFREVSAAYEVLGNVKLRKMYDKGLINDAQGGTRPEHPETKFYRSRETRTRPPPPDGRTPIYDFDEWSRQHYGATFAKDMHLKHRRRIRQMSEQYTLQANINNKFIFVMLFLSGIIMYLSAKKDNYDDVEVVKREKRR